MSFSNLRPFLDDTQDYTPINDLAVVTPNDGADLPGGICRGLIITATGTITIVTAAGSTVLLNIPAGGWPGVTYIRAKRVMATGTTIAATNIVACY